MITSADYNYPLGISGGFFAGKAVPGFSDYLNAYHVHFLRYLYYMCIMHGDGDYPLEISLEEMQRAFQHRDNSNCKPRIKKILIGEAPPPTAANYFYNPHSPWTKRGRPGKGSTAWTGAIQTALFPGASFTTKLDFLKACAREGFLLLDLFPYAIPFSISDRKKTSYKMAALASFGAAPTPYPNHIIDQLTYLICCIKKQIAFGFALKSVGEIIVSYPNTTLAFTGWAITHGIVFTIPATLDEPRAIPARVPGASRFLRVCGRQNLFGPCPILLNDAGF